MEEERLIRELKEKDAKRYPDQPWIELEAIAEEIVDGLKELEKEKKTDQGLLTHCGSMASLTKCIPRSGRLRKRGGSQITSTPRGRGAGCRKI